MIWGIILLMLGSVGLIGNVLDFQAYPLWALIIRLSISVIFILAGILRIYHKTHKVEKEVR